MGCCLAFARLSSGSLPWRRGGQTSQVALDLSRGSPADICLSGSQLEEAGHHDVRDVVRRLKAGAYEDFRRAWEPDSLEQWPAGMTKIWIARSEDDPDVIATWSLFELDQAGYEALRDDPEWMSAELGRVERMSEFETEVLASALPRAGGDRAADRRGRLSGARSTQGGSARGRRPPHHAGSAGAPFGLRMTGVGKKGSPDGLSSELREYVEIRSLSLRPGPSPDPYRGRTGSPASGDRAGSSSAPLASSRSTSSRHQAEQPGADLARVLARLGGRRVRRRGIRSERNGACLDPPRR